MTDLTDKEKLNFAYFQLVDESLENDFIGMLAYSLYKKNKVAYIKQFRKSHAGDSPSEKQIREWQHSQCTPEQTKMYKNAATGVIQAFTNEVITSKHLVLQQKENDHQNKTNHIDRRERELKEKDDRLSKKDAELKKREKTARAMEKICPAKRNSVATYFVGVSQGLLATFIYIAIAVLIFALTKWPIDFVTFFVNGVSNNLKP